MFLCRIISFYELIVFFVDESIIHTADKKQQDC